MTTFPLNHVLSCSSKSHAQTSSDDQPPSNSRAQSCSKSHAQTPSDDQPPSKSRAQSCSKSHAQTPSDDQPPSKSRAQPPSISDTQHLSKSHAQDVSESDDQLQITVEKKSINSPQRIVKAISLQATSDKHKRIREQADASYQQNAERMQVKYTKGKNKKVYYLGYVHSETAIRRRVATVPRHFRSRRTST